MKLSWKTGIALVIGGILLGGTLSAVGQSGGGEEKRMHFKGRHGMHLGKMVTSTSVVEGEEEGTFDTMRADGGVVTEIDGSTIAIERADGETVRIPTNGDTEIRRDHEEADVGDLERGDHVIAHRVKEGDADTVTRHVMAISEERYQEMEQQRAACEDDDESTECERRHTRHGPGGPHRPGARFEESAA